MKWLNNNNWSTWLEKLGKSQNSVCKLATLVMMMSVFRLLSQSNLVQELRWKLNYWDSW